MARIALVDPDQATGKTKDVFDRVKAYYQMVPGLQKGLAYLPETTDALWTLSLATASEGTIREELNGSSSRSPRTRSSVSTAPPRTCSPCSARNGATKSASR